VAEKGYTVEKRQLRVVKDLAISQEYNVPYSYERAR
jgi:hypothetical protein